MLAFVLLGPIVSDREYKDGEVMEMCDGDYKALSQWGIVRAATEAEAPAPVVAPEPVPAKGKGKAADPTPDVAPPATTDPATKP